MISNKSTMGEVKEAVHEVSNPVTLQDVGPQLDQGNSTVHANASSVEEASDPVAGSLSNLNVIGQISVPVEIVLGTTRISIKELLQIGRGAVIQLDRKVGEPIDVMVNNRLVATGELVVVNEETSQFGVKITGIVSPVSVS